MLFEDLKTVPPGFKSGMNFGTSDINLNLASALKPKHKLLEEIDNLEKATEEAETIIDLADLLKEKGSVFKWISEDVSSLQEQGILHFHLKKQLQKFEHHSVFII